MARVSNGFSFSSSTGCSGDAVGVQLRVDPLLQPHGVDALDVAGPRPERQPVQRLNNPLVPGNLPPESAVVRRTLWLARTCRNAHKHHQPGSQQRGS